MSENPKTPLIALQNVCVSFPVLRGSSRILVQAVRGISFSLEKGEILGIVGESGSGKSVTTSAIPGLLPPHALVTGSIRYEGTELIGAGKEKLRSFRGIKIGMIFQEPGRSYDPLQNMERVFLETFRNTDPELSREQARVRAVALLEEVGLDNAFERLSGFPHQFSGGQLQRIGIALALAQGCDLLIADEPTTALDVTIQAQIIGVLKKIRERQKIAIIFISHNIDVVAGISDRIMVMYGGLVMEEAVSRALLSAPRHPYSRALLAAAPQFGSHYSQRRLASIPGRVPDPSEPEPGCPFAPRCPSAVSGCSRQVPHLCAVSGKDGVLTKDDRRFVRCILDPEYKA